jgi:glyoxylate reductase
VSQPIVFITREIPEAGLRQVLAATQAEVWPGELPPPREILLAKVRGCHGLLCLLTERIDDELLEAAGPSLRVISQMAVGYDNIDVAAATARGIPVGNTPGVLTEATADLAWALLMAAARRVVEGDRFVRAGRWKTWGPKLLLGPDVAGATLGVVGFGRIGQAMARRARGFEMRVVYHARRRQPEAEATLGAQFAALDELLAAADFVTLHVPLNNDTRLLMNEARLRRMKPGAILINTARGPIVDHDALYRVLRSGALGGAALDVTDPEPLPPDSPLLSLENVIVVPHIASASIATRNRMAAMAAANLLAGLRGERLPNCVNPEVYGG